MSEAVKILRQQGFSELACQFAEFMARLDQSNNTLVSLTAGLLSETVSQGHVCLNLKQLTALPEVIKTQLPTQVSDWQSQLLQSNVVGQAGDYTPIVLTENAQLYLYRHWQDEQDVAKAIRQRSQTAVSYDAQQLMSDFQQWQSSISGTDWQKVAVLSAMTQGLTVISGGPGTGKTTIVKTLIGFLQHQQQDLRVALAAPTGKAAARLQQAVQSDSYQVEAKTLHRLLGITAANEKGRYSAERPLPIDVLIVDEASMVDISLMAKLLSAMPVSARLVLLGDSQQLASVESGAVLANLCEQQACFSPAFVELAEQCGITDLKASATENAVLCDQMVQLKHSYRFAAQGLIGQLATAVNHGHAEAVLTLLRSQSETVWLASDDQTVLQQCLQGYHPFIDAVEGGLSAKAILSAFDRFRLLAAIKQGPQSVTAVNRLISHYLNQRGWHSQQPFYHGRPIMITQNDYRQQLFNGDIGVVLRDETGQLKVCFSFDETLRWVALNRLPAHDTVFAMTVHKSQGSEFDAISILLPQEISPVLNRELLYTAITRAREQVSILADEAVLTHSVLTQHQRQTGLRAELEKQH